MIDSSATDTDPEEEANRQLSQQQQGEVDLAGAKKLKTKKQRNKSGNNNSNSGSKLSDIKQRKNNKKERRDVKKEKENKDANKKLLSQRVRWQSDGGRGRNILIHTWKRGKINLYKSKLFDVILSCVERTIFGQNYVLQLKHYSTVLELIDFCNVCVLCRMFSLIFVHICFNMSCISFTQSF